MKFFSLLASILCSFSVLAQPGKVVDRIIGVVGNEIILQSDLEASVLDATEGKGSDDGAMRCSVYENLLYQKLLLNQSKLDSMCYLRYQLICHSPKVQVLKLFHHH